MYIENIWKQQQQRQRYETYSMYTYTMIEKLHVICTKDEAERPRM